MPRRKPHGWPKLMTSKRLKGGAAAYFFSVPTWAKKAGCPVQPEALGTDYGIAKQRCDEILNPQYDAWRTRGEAVPRRLPPGTFDWMVEVYKSAPQFFDKEMISDKTRKSYDSVLRLVSQHKLKDGRKFGQLSLSSIVPGAADRLYAKLKLRPDGTMRVRTAVLAMRVCQQAWAVAFRNESKIVPELNPFAAMKLPYKAVATRPVTHAELICFVKAADDAGETSIGTAAMIAFYWLQRQTDILMRLSWGHYRPAGKPDMASIFHHKTGEPVDLPLFDEDGTVLWPEMMERLDAAPRHGSLIVTRDTLDRRRKIHLPWKEDYFRHRVADIRKAAGIDPAVKFMGLRHGGNTEGGDAGLTDAQLRALSGHKTSSMTHLYTKETLAQRREGARKRLQKRTKRGTLSE